MGHIDICALLPEQSIFLGKDKKNKRVVWPLPQETRSQLSKNVTGVLLRHVNAENTSKMGEICLLGLGGVFSKTRYWCELALLVESVRKKKLFFHKTSPDLKMFLGLLDNTAEDHKEYFVNKYGLKKNVKYKYVRRLLREKSMVNLIDLPCSFITSSHSFAISHNETLIAEAKLKRLRHNFVYAEDIVNEIRKSSDLVIEKCLCDEIQKTAESLAKKIISLICVDTDVREVTARLIINLIVKSLHQAATDWEKATLFQNLPNKIYSGSTGEYFSRLVCMASQRQGGNITVYAHGYFAGLAGQAESFLWSDISIANQYVVETKRCASNLINVLKFLPYDNLKKARIRNYEGLSPLAPWVKKVDRKVELSKRVKALYLPTVLMGERQFFPPLLPDELYLNWQFEFAKKLNGLEINLSIRPHPEGALREMRHPLGLKFEIEERTFEKCAQHYNLLIFDYGQSTTFPKALCTRTPILYVHMNTCIHSTKAKKQLRQRCGYLEVEYNEVNVPVVPNSNDLFVLIKSAQNKASVANFSTFYLGN